MLDAPRMHLLDDIPYGKKVAEILHAGSGENRHWEGRVWAFSLSQGTDLKKNSLKHVYDQKHIPAFGDIFYQERLAINGMVQLQMQPNRLIHRQIPVEHNIRLQLLVCLRLLEKLVYAFHGSKLSAQRMMCTIREPRRPHKQPSPVGHRVVPHNKHQLIAVPDTPHPHIACGVVPQHKRKIHTLQIESRVPANAQHLTLQAAQSIGKRLNQPHGEWCRLLFNTGWFRLKRQAAEATIDVWQYQSPTIRLWAATRLTRCWGASQQYSRKMSRTEQNRMTTMS
jgi:hypothetical protein